MTGGQFFLQVLDRLDVGFALVGPNHVLLTCNEAFARLAGVPRASMLEGTKLDEDADPVRIGLLLRARAGDLLDVTREIAMVPGGARRELRLRMARVDLPDHGPGTAILASAPDDAVVLASDRANLDALGRMAAGLAHEFNNLHAGILGYLEFILQNRTDLDEELLEDLKEVHGLAQRATSITKNLMAFAAQHHSIMGPVRPEAIVSEALARVAARSEAEDIVVRAELESGLPGVYVDRAQFVQILENLLTNALDAVYSSDEKRVLVRVGQTRDHVWFEVQDSGRGMDEHVRARAFEPFFTTKGSAASGDSPEAELRGVGLGLSVCKTLVDQHGGHIQVRSEPGKGTTVRVEVPKLQVAEERESEGQRPRVLVVDDEPAIRKLLVRGAELEGMEVEAVGDGVEGLELLRKGGYDILVLDLMMPGLDGREVLAELARQPASRRPRVVVTTGRITMLGEREEASIVDKVLRKPFSLADYRSALVELARGRDRSA